MTPRPALTALLLGLCAVAPTAAAGAGLAPLVETLPSTVGVPGTTDPRVTQANIDTTICVRGHSASVRPPVSYTEPLKRKMIARLGYADRRLSHYEFDHVISLELGGSPTDPRNLFPQPHQVVGGWGSYAKDRLEDRLHRLVCAHRLPLADAQRLISTNWVDAYQGLIGPVPNNARLHEFGD